MLYFMYVFSIISYGIIYCGNTGNGVTIFRTQEKFEKLLIRQRKWIHAENCLKHVNSLFSVYICSLNVCGEK